jgi:hypothetical protein
MLRITMALSGREKTKRGWNSAIARCRGDSAWSGVAFDMASGSQAMQRRREWIYPIRFVINSANDNPLTSNSVRKMTLPPSR